jgi:hypothetical protein
MSELATHRRRILLGVFAIALAVLLALATKAASVTQVAGLIP